MMALRRLVLLGALALLVAFGASAHELKTALTEVLYNPRSGQLEVAHRFIIHDAEHAMADMSGEPVDLASDPEAQDRFARQVAEAFSLSNGDRRQLDLTLLGSQIEAGYIWVYQEVPLDAVDPETLIIRQDALRERWPDQMNMVNVRKGDSVRSLTFTGADRYKQVRLGGQ